ncbi:hypothetical protein TRVL_04278 [Trypanosoma vivax]|nr:hypothetical protein TRVL_04278 [Trypanosoma vivax]
MRWEGLLVSSHHFAIAISDLSLSLSVCVCVPTPSHPAFSFSFCDLAFADGMENCDLSVQYVPGLHAKRMCFSTTGRAGKRENSLLERCESQLLGGEPIGVTGRSPICKRTGVQPWYGCGGTELQLVQG